MMKKYLTVSMTLFLIIFSNSAKCFAQSGEYIESSPVFLSGPRLGVSIIGGSLANKLKKDYNANPFITQFGWQFEWRFISIEDGPAGIVECIPLMGGLEQGLFLPSLTTPIGLRFRNGFEFGTGPSVSLTGFSIAIAMGYTFQSGRLSLPLNISILPSKAGARFSLTFGFNMRRS
jgi:hypothetical protein